MDAPRLVMYGHGNQKGQDMIFKLEISLDNAEIADNGIDQALPGYLRQVAQRCQDGIINSGRVRDGNGNTIGTYWTEED